MARTIVIAVKDLLFGSKLHEASKRSGVAVQWASRFQRLSDEARTKAADVVIADLMEPGIIDELAIVKRERPATQVIGFLGHERVDLAEAASAIGVGEILTRGQMAKRAESLLKQLADA